MDRPDDDRPLMRDMFDELTPERVRERRERFREDDQPDDGDPTDDGETQAQSNGPGTFERAGAFLDDIAGWGNEQMEQLNSLSEKLSETASEFGTAAAEIVGSAAGTAWDGVTGGGGDGDDGDDGDGSGGDGGDSSGGDTISGGDLVELQSSPTEQLPDPGVLIEPLGGPGHGPGVAALDDIAEPGEHDAPSDLDDTL